jgi:hypothetical protein
VPVIVNPAPGLCVCLAPKLGPGTKHQAGNTVLLLVLASFILTRYEVLTAGGITLTNAVLCTQVVPGIHPPAFQFKTRLDLLCTIIGWMAMEKPSCWAFRGPLLSDCWSSHNITARFLVEAKYQKITDIFHDALILQ